MSRRWAHALTAAILVLVGLASFPVQAHAETVKFSAWGVSAGTSSTLGSAAETLFLTGTRSVSSTSGNRLLIPRIHINLPIGVVQSSALRRGVWLQAGGAAPGQPGNVVMAGHRISGIFATLYHVRKGDRVVVRWKGVTRTYRVAVIRTIKPTDISWVRRAGNNRLTLYTCIPRYLGNKRTVVVAYPVTP